MCVYVVLPFLDHSTVDSLSSNSRPGFGGKVWYANVLPITEFLSECAGGGGSFPPRKLNLDVF